MAGLALRVWSLLLWLAQPLLRRKLARRALQEPGYALAVPERFGHYTQAAQPGAIWIHAVSLGETRAAAVLIAGLRAARPGCRILLTHGTATGRAEGQGLLREGDAQAWLPWDTPGAVKRFLAHFRPCMGLLMETEVWPNLVAACRAQGVPLLLLNARLSAKSLRQAQRLAWLSLPAYQGLHAVLAQTEADAARLRQLGAPVQAVPGNLKFDATPDAALLALGRSWHSGPPVLMFASSREGEEAALLALIGQQRALERVQGQAQGEVTDPSANRAVQWLIVPRHPQRFDEVAALVQGAGLSLARRSAWGGQGPGAADVWLGDSLGEMPLYYGLADAVLLGGSFAPLGGQNLIEAAACGCPVFSGPHSFNFAEAMALAQQAGAAQVLPDMAGAVQAAIALCADAPALAAARQSCEAFAQAHRGAQARTVQALCALLDEQ